MQLYGLFIINTNTPVPLVGVNVSAKIVDYTAEVEIVQYFANQTVFNAEAKYLFPVDEKV